jgi:hypothetical protein
MLYNIEIAQAFSAENTIKQELFYKSMLNSFEQAIVYMIGNGILNEFKIRLMHSSGNNRAKLENEQNFNAIIERFEY